MTSEGATRALAPRSMPRVRDVWVDPVRGRSEAGVDAAVPDAEPVGRPGIALRRGVNPADWVEAVYEEFHSEVYSFALRSTREVAAAEDATQEAFIRLLREAREHRAPDDARAWLYRVISNLVISGGRRATVAQRWRAVLARRESPTNPSPEATAMRRERRDAVQIALDAMSPEFADGAAARSERLQRSGDRARAGPDRARHACAAVPGANPPAGDARGARRRVGPARVRRRRPNSAGGRAATASASPATTPARPAPRVPACPPTGAA